MSTSVCGDCKNFQPKKGAKFFNCTSAKQAGIGYGMQVRTDTRACDAFLPSKPTPMLSTDRAQPAWRGPWWKALFLILLILAVGLLSWGLYTLFSNPPLPSNMPTPTPTSTPTATPVATPTPTPLPSYEIKIFDISVNSPATTSDRMITVYSTSRVNSYTLLTGRIISALPGTVFIFISVDAMNIGKTAFSIQAGDFSLTDSTGNEYTHQTDNYLYYIGNPFGGTLAPTQIDDGKILYIVPVTASGLELSYLLNPTSTPPVIAKWKLPY